MYRFRRESATNGYGMFRELRSGVPNRLLTEINPLLLQCVFVTTTIGTEKAAPVKIERNFT